MLSDISRHFPSYGETTLQYAMQNLQFPGIFLLWPDLIALSIEHFATLFVLICKVPLSHFIPSQIQLLLEKMHAFHSLQFIAFPFCMIEFCLLLTSCVQTSTLKPKVPQFAVAFQ